MLCSVCVKAEWASLSLSEELDESFQCILDKRDCRLSSAIIHQDDETLQNPVRQILSLFNRLTEQLKKRGVGGSSPPPLTASKHDLIGLKCKEVYTPNLCRRLLIKTKSSTEQSTFPTVCLNFILTAKEINCHMPPNFFLQTSCAMLRKPQQKLAQASWSSAWLGINSHHHSEHTKLQHNIDTNVNFFKKQDTLTLKSIPSNP